MEPLLKVQPATAPWSNRKRQYLERKNPDKTPNTQHEARLLRQVCHYLKLQYPRVIFRSDTSSGRWEYTRKNLDDKVALNSSRSFPDLFIYEPRVVNGVQYAGLALELKKDGTTIYVKRGERKGQVVADKHIREQELFLRELNKRGYFARFGIGFDNCQRIIDGYMGKIKTPDNGELF